MTRSLRRAFTLSEVVVTAVVALILSAIAVPQFTAGSTAAVDNTAQLTAQSADAAEMSYFQSNQAFTSSPATLAGLDGSISYVQGTTASTNSTTASVAVSANGQVMGVAVLGSNFNCWLLRQSLNPAASYDAPVLYAELSSSNSLPCAAASALTMNSQSGKFLTAQTGLSWTDPIQLP